MATVQENMPITVPPPLLVVMEDVGWWSGFSGPGANEPFRTGMGRMHVPEDYTALVRLARALNTQILLGFVLCEWDRDGMLRDLPSATWQGRNWTGYRIDRSIQDEAASILNDHSDALALALHGVGHEFWAAGRMSRTEFHDDLGTLREKSVIQQHLSYFGRLLESSGIKSPFPKVFIPPALRHSFGNGTDGFQKMLADVGIEYVLTVFGKARQHHAPLSDRVTFECGVTLIERGLSPVAWDTVAATPRFDFSQPVLPLHWANLLHPDPSKNAEVADAWASFLREGASLHGVIVLPSVMESLVQTVCHHLIRLVPSPDSVTVDLSGLRRVNPKHKNPPFYMTLPATARLDARQGFAKPADAIRPGLFRITPAADCDYLRIIR